MHSQFTDPMIIIIIIMRRDLVYCEENESESAGSTNRVKIIVMGPIKRLTGSFQMKKQLEN